ncbi:MAG: hypothetical protein JNK67_24585 [Alphaproteobacteria bacterium]|nr:hypothetical protein [Alphaproteobacteria bacterium]
MADARIRDGQGLRLAAAAPAGLVVLRVRADDAETRLALAAALGTALPLSPAQPTGIAGARLFWTSPDALLLDLDASADVASTVERLAAALSGRHAAVHDVTDARTWFTIGGPHARAVLAKGTGIDLDPRALPPGAAALTRFAGLTVLLAHRDDGARYELLADRAVEDWLWAWLLDAGDEYAVAR